MLATSLITSPSWTSSMLLWLNVSFVSSSFLSDNRQCIRSLWDWHHSSWLDLLYLGCYLHLAHPDGHLHNFICMQRVSKLHSNYLLVQICQYSMQLKLIFLSLLIDPGLSVCCPTSSIFAGCPTWWWMWRGCCCGTERKSSDSAYSLRLRKRNENWNFPRYK